MNVLVYGTLREGHHANHLLGYDAELLDVVHVKGLKMFNVGHFPGVVEAADDDHVIGEVWKVEDFRLQQLDAYEGYPDLYTRKQVLTACGDAWVYLFNNPTDHLEEVEGGDWNNAREAV